MILNQCWLPAYVDDDPSLQDPKEPDAPVGSWDGWFLEYTAEKPTALQRITFRPYNAPVNSSLGEDDLGEIEEGEVTSDTTASEMELRAFPYALVNEYHEMIHESTRVNGDRARLGLDLHGWYELMSVMKRNREKMIVEGRALLK